MPNVANILLNVPNNLRNSILFLNYLLNSKLFQERSKCVAHRSTFVPHRSKFVADRSKFVAHRSSPDLHRSNLDLNRSRFVAQCFKFFFCSLFQQIMTVATVYERKLSKFQIIFAPPHIILTTEWPLTISIMSRQTSFWPLWIHSNLNLTTHCVNFAAADHILLSQMGSV